MVGYNDPYNQAITAKSNAMVRQHAKDIDRLNGSGKAKATGGAYCPANYDPVTDPATGKTYSNKCHMSAAKQKSVMDFAGSGGGVAGNCCARCKNCKCGKGMSGGAADTPYSAKEWFKAEDRQFEDQVHKTITPRQVTESRMERDLGAGKGGRKCGRGWMDKLGKATQVGNILAQNLLGDEGKSGKLKKAFGVAENVRGALQGEGQMSRGMRGCGNELSSNPNVTPPEVARMRAKLDLGAGKFQGGAAAYDDEDEDENYEDGDDCGEMEGGAADYDDEPETLREMKSICDDYEQQKLTGGAMTKRVRAMLPHGKKGMSVALSKALQKLKKRGRASYARRIKAGMMVPGRDLPGEVQPHKGSGRYVGGAKDHGEIERIHDSVFGGSRMTGGYGPVAPTTEALAGYDNRAQPRGLKPPPSVNQQPGMTGGAVPLQRGQPLAKKDRPNLVGPAQGRGVAGGVSGGAHPLIPIAQLPSKIGGGRFSKKGDYIGPSTGAIIPNLQSDAAPKGAGVSGGRASRGAAVAKLMREKGMTLGEASKALKGGAYTANDFFMPRNIHQFFGAYA